MSRVLEPTRVVRGWPEAAARLSIPRRFEDLVRANPAAHAVRTASHTITYGAVNETANRLARALLAKADSSTVAVLAGHGASMLIGMLAVLKAGKIFVPLDPRQPRARMLQIFEDCEARLLLTDEKQFSAGLDLVGAGARILNVDAPDRSFSADNLDLQIDHHSTACLHYTSGSTGSPKGVLQTHRNLIHKTMAFTEALELSRDDRLIQLASCATGQGLSTALQGLLNGASLHPFDIRETGLGKLAASLAEQEITVYRSSASIFRHFVKTLAGNEVFPRLRMITVGGERIRPEDVEGYKQHFSESCRFACTFSATETGLITIHLMDHATKVADVVPVGYPRNGLTITIVDDDSREVPIGEPGEIVVRSSLLSPGYWRDPARTAEVFSVVPDSDERIYRTGDLGRLRADGALEHLGRKDFRIKLRGFRVELEEIERTLRAHPFVSEAVAAFRRDGTGEERICAYVIAEATRRPTATELRMHMRNTLPEQMVPSTFVFLDVLPLAASGKVDRSALPAPGPDCVEDDAAAMPLSPVERTVLDIWRVVLGRSPAGTEQDFFESGGDSLRAGQVLSRIYQEFHVDVPVTKFMEAPTIARLAQLIDRQLEAEETARLETIACLLAEVENIPEA